MATVLIGQAPTNLGPLTTTFTPPPECTAAVGAASNGLADFFGVGDAKDVAYLGQGCSRGKAFDATTCWPGTSKGAEEKGAPLYGWGFYSPGLHCPVGYATACSATGGSGGGSGWPVQFKLRDGETAVGCCPSGYGCANINGQTCTMMATSTTIPTVTCDGNEIGDGASMTVPSEEASITAFSLLAPMIQINWQSSDRPKSTTSFRASVTKTSTTGRVRSTSSETSTGETESDNTSETKTSDGSRGETLVLDEHPQTTGGEVDIGGGAPTTTPTLQENESSPDNGAMSSGAKVAIGVASAVGVLMVLVCALFYCWRKRKTRREEQELDRLYGLKHSMSIGGDFTNSSDIPGWYRGQRLATATKDPFGVHDANHGAMMPEMERPAAPYYRPYRPA
ncbi:hypothetical protein CHGG_02058 [Chaetomium globosum CBS 148.51]|uniref:Mid2 domain-containing protein n=1 Tax=Chaetomium globosum (strain ATCC 6205 / CBS 148.51 / DSM 1962 / NBRC 6347 / NRRL 1970) TaxID=306901 RepID=Q2HCJ6_CHAGB|nr:uncharacterized protein CHGG_02058 [Chaetomium globosum CBS 148.51]EAQ93823.1 hypothetical protein CHGG_02058 [Chaetomium globosum CBS 148.51]